MPTVATSTFNPPAATYDVSLSVSLLNANSDLPGFAQYYTTDGSTPTSGSTAYTGVPISVAATTTVKVLAQATGFTDSAIATALFTITAPINPTDVEDSAERISTEHLGPNISGRSSTSRISTEPV